MRTGRSYFSTNSSSRTRMPLWPSSNAFQVPSNKGAMTSDKTPDLSTLKLIDYDFKKYGSSDERKRLLQKWDEEVSTLPQ